MVYLNPTATIGAQIDETLRLHFPNYTSAKRYEKAIELLHTVELSDAKSLYHRYPHELSGGMRQRVMIAIALSPNPRVFIADEITTALDVSVGQDILILLKKLQKNLAMSVIFITHDLSIITQFASRVIVMYKGRVMEQGNTQDICFSPKHPYTKGLIDSIPTMVTDPNSRLPVIKVLRDKIEGACPFYHKCSFAKDTCKVTPKQLTWEENRGYLCHFPLNQEQEVLCPPTPLSLK
nr:ABC transporter ATP-binding protein [bacterium]